MLLYFWIGKSVLGDHVKWSVCTEAKFCQSDLICNSFCLRWWNKFLNFNVCNFFMVDDMCVARFYSIYFGSKDNSGWFILGVICQFTPVMSSVVETSQWGFLRSLCSVEMTEEVIRSVEMTVSVNMYVITYFNASSFCSCCDWAHFRHFLNGYDMNVCNFNDFMLWSGGFWWIFDRTRHVFFVYERFCVVTGRILLVFRPITTLQDQASSDSFFRQMVFSV